MKIFKKRALKSKALSNRFLLTCLTTAILSCGCADRTANDYSMSIVLKNSSENTSSAVNENQKTNPQNHNENNNQNTNPSLDKNNDNNLNNLNDSKNEINNINDNLLSKNNSDDIFPNEQNKENKDYKEFNQDKNNTDTASLLSNSNSYSENDPYYDRKFENDEYIKETIIEHINNFTPCNISDDTSAFDDFDKILAADFTGLWYDPEMKEAILITDESAYVYIPYLDKYSDEIYKWEVIDRSRRDLCPELAIYFQGTNNGPLAYYVGGIREKYFWCVSQQQVFYKIIDDSELMQP